MRRCGEFFYELSDSRNFTHRVAVFPHLRVGLAAHLHALHQKNYSSGDGMA